MLIIIYTSRSVGVIYGKYTDGKPYRKIRLRS